MQIELKRLQAETGITFVFVTHDQEEALTMSDRIAVMSQGKVRQIGGARDIYDRPSDRFVADFIGETNQFAADIVDATKVRVGETEFACAAHELPAGEATAVIRPVDIIPHGAGAGSPGAPDAVGTPENLVDVTVEEMEFLGAFWRCRLSSARFGEKLLVADFSINAVRRLGIEVGAGMQVELPQGRLLVFPRKA